MPRGLFWVACALAALIGYVSAAAAAPLQPADDGGTANADALRLAQGYFFYDRYDRRRHRYQRPRAYRPRPKPEPAPVLWKTEEGNEDPIQLIVSLPDQTMRVYKGTELVATSRVSSGMPGYRTPAGVFSILEKKRYHYSNIYGGAPMPYMQRLTWSGVALHASGSVPGYPASHGCVRLPPSFARQLFPFTHNGAHVIVANEAVTPEQFSHPALFQPVGPEPEETPEPVAAAAETTQSTDAGAGAAKEEQSWFDWIMGGATAKAEAETKVAEAEPSGDGDTSSNAGETSAETAADSEPAHLAQPQAAAAKPAIEYEAGAVSPPDDAAAAVDESKPGNDAAEAREPDAPLRILITLRTGRERMLEIQKLLFDLGHEPGDIDGYMGRDTATAIKRFQEFEGLPVNGLMSDDLLSKLHKAAGIKDNKEGHIYVRRDHKDVFDAPIQINQPDKPLGTHLFTVMHFDQDATQAQWLAVSLKDRGPRQHRARHQRGRNEADEEPAPAPTTASATEVLDRIVVSADLRTKISRMLAPGSSLAISDYGLGPETGKGTDFIVLTH